MASCTMLGLLSDCTTLNLMIISLARVYASFRRFSLNILTHILILELPQLELRLLLRLQLILVRDIDLLVRTLLIDLHNMCKSFLHKWSSNVFHVPKLRSLLYISCYHGVLEEDLVEEVFRKSNSFDVLDSHIDELRFLVEGDVVVTNELIGVELDSHPELFLRKTLSHQVETHFNLSLKDEVHVCHLVFLIQN